MQKRKKKALPVKLEYEPLIENTLNNSFFPPGTEECDLNYPDDGV